VPPSSSGSKQPNKILLHDDLSKRREPHTQSQSVTSKNTRIVSNITAALSNVAYLCATKELMETSNRIIAEKRRPDPPAIPTVKPFVYASVH